jgi:hypothetical protein
MSVGDLYEVYACGSVDGRYVCNSLGYRVISGGFDDPVTEAADLAYGVWMDGWAKTYSTILPPTYALHAIRAYYSTAVTVGGPCGTFATGQQAGEVGTTSMTSGVGAALSSPYYCLKSNSYRASRFVLPAIAPTFVDGGELNADYYLFMKNFAVVLYDTVATDNAVYAPGVLSDDLSPTWQPTLGTNVIPVVRTNRRRLQDEYKPGRYGSDYVFCAGNCRGFGSNLDISKSTLYLPDKLNCTFPTGGLRFSDWQYYAGNVVSASGVYITAGTIGWTFPTFTTGVSNYTPAVYWTLETDSTHPTVITQLTCPLVLNSCRTVSYPGQQRNDTLQMSGHYLTLITGLDTGVTAATPVAHPR